LQIGGKRKESGKREKDNRRSPHQKREKRCEEINSFFFPVAQPKAQRSRTKKQNNENTSEKPYACPREREITHVFNSGGVIFFSIGPFQEEDKRDRERERERCV
jgi:hypothetical protein